MPGHDIIVMGASAGGVEALSELVQGLPEDLPAALFVVQHFPAHSTSVLPQILNRRGRLHAAHPQNGEPIRHGRIYVAPPDQHLLIHRGYVRLARGPRENSNRPAIDPLFRTAAHVYGRRVVGVMLSGTLDDGTAGLVAIKMRGGMAVVQDPQEALYESMPRSAIEHVAVDYVLPASRIPAVLADLAQRSVTEEGAKAVSQEMELETEMAEMAPAAVQRDERAGTPSTFSCPECGGVLWELQEDELVHYRCRVGHAFSNESLIAEQSDRLEAALWTALRALKESGALGRRVAKAARERGRLLTAARFERQAHDADRHAAVIQQVLMSSRADSVAIPSERPPQEAQPATRERAAEREQAGAISGQRGEAKGNGDVE